MDHTACPSERRKKQLFACPCFNLTGTLKKSSLAPYTPAHNKRALNYPKGGGSAKNLDNFLKHVKNNLKSRIGEAFYPFIDYHISETDGRKVLFVDCKASESPCFLDANDFYVRTNPATDKLEGPKFLEYVKHRFGS